MAEAAVVLLINKVASVLTEVAVKQGFTLLGREASQLQHVHDRLRAIQDELLVMRGFLQNADRWVGDSSDSALKAWVQTVREVAYQAEDIVDEVSYLLVQRRRGGVGTFLHRALHVRPWHHVVDKLQGIESRLSQLSTRKDRYGINVTHKTESSSDAAETISKRVAEVSRLIQEDDVVGIDDNKATLIQWLIDGDELRRQRLCSVWGMGGGGKTTLVSQVYRSHEVRNLFNCRAWVSVSQTYQVEDLLRSVFKQLTSMNEEVDLPEITTMTSLQLAENLQNFLQDKKYLVIIDDVWDVQAWDLISRALIDNNCGSRIVFTTRIHVVAQLSPEKFRMKLEPLQEEDAWSLFCKKAFRDPCGSCPPELEDCARKIMSKCQGLPLAIVAVGGMLSLKDQCRREWEILYQGLTWELDNNTQLQNVKSILSLSVRELPYYLRNCLLYCSVFPEDTPIKRKMLILLWVAEGLVEQRGQRTVEEVAEENVNELVHRCLLQVVGRGRTGRIKVCRVHDIVRDLLLSISEEEKFSMIYDNRGSRGLDVGGEDVRRLSVHSQPNVDAIRSWQGKAHQSNLHSLLVHSNIGAELMLSSMLSSWRLLRILDLQGALTAESLPRVLFDLFNLRYLGLRKTNVRYIPNSIRRLINLEMLDIRDTNIRKLPRGVTNLKKLRHLFLRQEHFDQDIFMFRLHSISCPKGTWNLKDLQTLDGVIANDEMVHRLGNLTQLRSLRITEVKQAQCRYLCVAINKMRKLYKLSVMAEGEAALDLDDLSHPPPLLNILALGGRLKGGALPVWFRSLDNLTFLSLSRCQLTGDEDPLPSLDALSHLVTLLLHDNAFVGPRLFFQKGWFLKLQALWISRLSQLQIMEIEEGALRSLNVLGLRYCQEMKEIPKGILHLTALQDLPLIQMPDDFLKSLEKEGDKVQHIPVIRHFFHGEDLQWDVGDPRKKGDATIFELSE